MLTATPSPQLVNDFEVWRPNDGQLLRHGQMSGSSADSEAADNASQSLVDQVAETLSPAVRNDLVIPETGAFVIGGAAELAIPCRRNDELRGILTLTTKGDPQNLGAMEVWRRNPREELGLESAYYVNLDRFGKISQYVKFPCRAGLPGVVWDQRSPKLLNGLGTSKDFMRAAGAKADGLSVGIGIPVMAGPHVLDAVVLLLSSAATPIARVFEIWTPHTDGEHLQLTSASYGPFVELTRLSQGLRLSRGEGLAGLAWQDEAPVATPQLASCEAGRHEKFSEYGITRGASLPAYVGDRLEAIVNLLG